VCPSFSAAQSAAAYKSDPKFQNTMAEAKKLIAKAKAGREKLQTTIASTGN
jgi:hypothetical protein